MWWCRYCVALVLLASRECGGLAYTYFAFGSNVHRSVFSERRDIKPLALARGRVVDYRLAFNLRGFSEVEPSFASIEPALGEEVHGMVYLLSPVDWLRLCASEGAGLTYAVENVRVELYRPEGLRFGKRQGTLEETSDGRLLIEARTLRTRPGPWRVDQRADEPKPSERYLNLIKEGAMRRGLDATWQQQLDRS